MTESKWVNFLMHATEHTFFCAPQNYLTALEKKNRKEVPTIEVEKLGPIQPLIDENLL